MLITKSDDLTRAYSEGKHLFYVVRVILFMIKPKGVLNTKYRGAEFGELKEYDLCEPCSGIEIRRLKEETEDKVIDKLMKSEDELGTPYYRLLAEALKMYGTAGKVSKATGIPKSSVQVGIKKIRQYIKDE